MSTIDEILRLTPGDGSQVDEWFIENLKTHIDAGLYPGTSTLTTITENIVEQLQAYKHQHSISDVVIGMSGGVDSATTAALFKQAGWTVHGVTLPIHQKQDETNRGIEAIDTLRLESYNFDLSEQYDSMQKFLNDADKITYRGLQRQGNIRARLRMMTLYNLAHRVGGCVASTDNFSELAAGFWTLHGDVGDVAPIQSLTKSWEVPAIAEMIGVPESTVNALPTDGLGISNSDSDQLGMSYLEFDVLLFNLLSLPIINEDTVFSYINSINNLDVQSKARLVYGRVCNTAYKRRNPYNLLHPIFNDRFNTLEILDRSKHV
jgi:NAD+ synthase